MFHHLKRDFALEHAVTAILTKRKLSFCCLVDKSTPWQSIAADNHRYVFCLDYQISTSFGLVNDRLHMHLEIAVSAALGRYIEIQSEKTLESQNT